MNEEYIHIQTGKELAYVKISCIDRLREADAVIFDCDGVLIDTRDSYSKSIVETVKFFVNKLTDVELPSDKDFSEMIYTLKKSGGFNNDWDSAYVILLFLFSKLPKKFQIEFISLTQSERSKANTPRERLLYFITSLKSRPSGFTKNINELTLEMKQFAMRADDSGIESIESMFMNSGAKSIFLATKHFLNYPSNVKESLLTTVFDEMFYGQALFEKIHRRKRQFYDGVGFVEIEKERILITSELLEELEQAIESNNFGIVSGRDRFSARFSLARILDKFKSEATIFLMDNKYTDKKSQEERNKFRKPNPYPLFTASKGFERFKYSLYVGDSAEDIIMVKRANEIDQRFISVGVYSLSNFKDALLSYFFKEKTDVILYSINELPPLLRSIKVNKQ